MALWLNKDPCGLFGAVFTQALIVMGVLGGVSLLNLTTLLGCLAFTSLLFCAFMAAASHLKCMLTDPGAVPKLSPDTVLEDVPRGELIFRNGEYVSVCKHCHTYKPERAHHCRLCGRCIRKMDHHCPWVNNCVGEYNQKYFIQFTSYIFLAAFSLLLLLINFFKTCEDLSECVIHVPRNDPSAQHISPVALIGVIMEIFVFGLFTLIMTCDQLYNIAYATSTIDKKKGNRQQKKATAMENLAVVFGSRFGLAWLHPFTRPKAKSRVVDHVV